MTYYNSELFPFIYENFLTAPECDVIVSYTEKHLELFDNKQQPDSFWDKRVINVKDFQDHNIRDLIVHINKNVGSIIKQLTNREVYPDTLQVVRWIRGYELKPHADKENPDGNPHPFPWRDFATLVYLNDNYVGGEIWWPNKNKEIKPKKGSLVIFPGTLEFLHGVRETTEGSRYTLPSFFTLDASRSLNYDSISR
jgi:hypothetical protein